MKVKQLLTRTAGAFGVTTGLLFVGSPLMAQVKIGDNPNSINPSSILELESTSKALLLPRVPLQALGTKDPVTNAVKGMHVYNTTENSELQEGEYYFDGSVWVPLVSDIAYKYIDGFGAPTGACPAKTIYTDVDDNSGTYGQQWKCISGSWVAYSPPARTPFYAGNTTNDAGASKKGLITRFGNVNLKRLSDPNNLNSVIGSTQLIGGGAIRLFRSSALDAGNGGFIDFTDDAAKPALYRIGIRPGASGGNSGLAFHYDTNVRMVLSPSGQLGIGTGDPNAKLHVNGEGIFGAANASTASGLQDGTSATDGILLYYADPSESSGPFGRAQIFVQSTGNTPNLVLSKRNSVAADDFIVFRTNLGAPLGAIEQGGGSIQFGTVSDRRLKENIKDTHYSIEDLMKVGVVDYTYKSDNLKTPVTGFIAQDLYNVFPNAVSKGGDDVTKKPWMVDYSKITPLLVKAIQDQQKKIESLEAQLSEMNALKAEVASIKAMLGNAEQQKSEATISK